MRIVFTGGKATLCFACLLNSAQAATKPASAPAPPTIEVRLINHLTSYTSPRGTPFECVVIRKFEVDGKTAIPAGSKVFGKVTKATRVGLGLIHERASLDLEFYEVETPDGQRFPIHALLASIDNSRERVTSKGRIRGVLAANNPTNVLNGFWAKPEFSIFLRSGTGLTGVANQIWKGYSMGPIGAAGLYAVRCALVSFPEPEIHLPPGTDMRLRLSAPIEPHFVTEYRESFDVPATQITADLPSWLPGKLDPILYGNGQNTADLFNIILVGSAETIESSFVGSGWVKADRKSLMASSRVFAAFSAKRSYAAAPVSRLYYRGAEPDMVFEKSFDTVTQRHHIRLWDGGMVNGQQVWLGAATHDTGVKFKAKSFRFTHKIDPNIDPERDKVVTDLSFTGCAAPPAYLDMPKGYKTNLVNTDERIAVLDAKTCEAPSLGGDAPPRPGNKFTRLTRRAILEARNYVERDNAYYWTYQIISTKFGTRPKTN
jgi:hypothetical protein